MQARSEKSCDLISLFVCFHLVGGISVKEHFEINVVPLAVRVTSRFYQALHDYFFDKDAPDSPPGEPSTGERWGGGGGGRERRSEVDVWRDGWG